MPERIARLIILNTGLPTGEAPMGEAFMQWREFAWGQADLPIGQVIRADRLKQLIILLRLNSARIVRAKCFTAFIHNIDTVLTKL
jgi:hypothetical protein